MVTLIYITESFFFSSWFRDIILYLLDNHVHRISYNAQCGSVWFLNCKFIVFNLNIKTEFSYDLSYLFDPGLIISN